MKFRIFLSVFLLLFNSMAFAGATREINVFNWANYLPDEVIRQFTQETGIRVNYTTYDSNETLYAKLKTNRGSGYDIAIPSTYFLDRMRKEGMLEKIDKTKISNFKHLNPSLLNQSYDPHNEHSVPYLWGSTGLVVNLHYFPAGSVKRWADLWDKKYRDQLLLLDDQREAFSMALKTLGYSINDADPGHIKQAYLKLKELMANVKLFNSVAVQAVYIDEDATIGMGYNGDTFLVNKENPAVQYIYPAEGATLWLDSLVIPKNAPHLEEAYIFINFLLRPDVAEKLSMSIGYASPNRAAIKRMSKEVRENRMIYPNKQDLKNSEFQTDVGDANLLYEKYWELLKIGG